MTSMSHRVQGPAQTGDRPPSQPVPPKIHQELIKRTDTAQQSATRTAYRDLARYYSLLARTLSDLPLTSAEALVLWEVIRQARARDGDSAAGPRPPLSLQVEAAMKRAAGSSRARNVRPNFARWIGSLDPLQQLALIDAIERMLVLIDREGWSDVDEMLTSLSITSRSKE